MLAGKVAIVAGYGDVGKGVRLLPPLGPFLGRQRADSLRRPLSSLFLSLPLTVRRVAPLVRLARHHYRDRPDQRPPGGHGRLRGHDHGGRRRPGQHLRHHHRLPRHHPRRALRGHARGRHRLQVRRPPSLLFVDLGLALAGFAPPSPVATVLVRSQGAICESIRRRAGGESAAVIGGRLRRTRTALPLEPRAGPGRPCGASPALCTSSTMLELRRRRRARFGGAIGRRDLPRLPSRPYGFAGPCADPSGRPPLIASATSIAASQTSCCGASSGGEGGGELCASSCSAVSALSPGLLSHFPELVLTFLHAPPPSPSPPCRTRRRRRLLRAQRSTSRGSRPTPPSASTSSPRSTATR